MKKIKNLFATILVISCILMCSSCSKNRSIRPTVNAGENNTIISPISSIMLSGIIRYDINSPDREQVISSEWTTVSTPEPNLQLQPIIESPLSLQTNVTGLIKPGKYVFKLMCKFSRGWESSAIVVITVITPSNIFRIHPNFNQDAIVYTVQTIQNNFKDILDSDGHRSEWYYGNWVRALSFRNGTDSASITFGFLNATAIPADGTTRDFWIVESAPRDNEVVMRVVVTRGTDGTQYIGKSYPPQKATVFVNAIGKISIQVAEALAGSETGEILVTANISEP